MLFQYTKTRSINTFVFKIQSGAVLQENIRLNHAVQLVGYGTDETLGDYWLVRPFYLKKHFLTIYVVLS